MLDGGAALSALDGFRLVSIDVAAAQARMEDGQNLSADQWAAWIWMMTDAPTAPIAEWDTKRGPARAVSYRLEGRVQVVNYYDPAQIADRDSIWALASLGQMREWVLMLEDDQWRYAAANAVRGVRTTDDGAAYYAQQARRILDRLRPDERGQGLTAPLAPAAAIPSRRMHSPARTPLRAAVGLPEDDADPYSDDYPARQAIIALAEEEVRARLAAAAARRAEQDGAGPTGVFFAEIEAEA
jgi:hypothetical protein